MRTWTGPGGCCLALSLTLWAASPGNAAPAAAVRLEDSLGKLVLRIVPEGKGFRVESSAGKKLGSVKVEADRVKSKDDGGKPRYKIKSQPDGFKLYQEPATAGGADVEMAQWIVQAECFRLKAPDGKIVFSGKNRETRVKVQNAAGKDVYALKGRPDGSEIEDPAGKRLFRLKPTATPASSLFAVIPGYDPLARATVLAYEASIGASAGGARR